MLRLLAIILFFSSRAGAAITYGSDYISTASTTADSLTQTATLGSTGANSILFVVVSAESNYSTPIAVDYNGTAMTSLGGKVTYSGTTTIYREVFYLNANLTSGQNIHVFSGFPITLGTVGATAWHIRYWTYGGVSGLGTTSVNATNFVTSNSGSPVSVAFNFTPSASTSTILQLLVDQSSSFCGSTYATANGTVRQTLTWTGFGAKQEALPFSDYAPGSTSLYSLSQSWNPNFCFESAYGWGIEMLAVASDSPTFTPTVTPTFTVTPTWTPTATPSACPTFTPTVTQTATPTFTPTVTPTACPTVTATISPSPTKTVVIDNDRRRRR